MWYLSCHGQHCAVDQVDPPSIVITQRQDVSQSVFIEENINNSTSDVSAPLVSPLNHPSITAVVQSRHFFAAELFLESREKIRTFHLSHGSARQPLLPE